MVKQCSPLLSIEFYFKMEEFRFIAKRKMQVFLDGIANKKLERWIFFFLVLGFLVLRIWLK
jgi:uncharacterized membrane protein